MGNLTGDMIRLRQEIGAWRQDRRRLGRELARDTRAMKVAVKKLRTEMQKTQAHTAKLARAERLGFVTELKSQVFGLRRGHFQALQQMAAEGRGARRALVDGLKTEVGRMRAVFRRQQADLAQKGRTARRQFVSHLGRTVSHLRQEAADDLAGARRGFFGPSRAEKEKAEEERPAQEKEEPRRQAATLAAAERQRPETERRVREEKRPNKGK